MESTYKHIESPFSNVFDGFLTVVLEADTCTDVAEFIHGNMGGLLSSCNAISIVDETASHRYAAVLNYDLFGNNQSITIPGFNPLGKGTAFIVLSVDIDFVLTIKNAVAQWARTKPVITWLTAFPRDNLTVRRAVCGPSTRSVLLEDAEWIDDTHASNTMDYVLVLDFEQSHPSYRWVEVLLDSIFPGHDLDYGVTMIGTTVRYWFAVRCDAAPSTANDVELFLQSLIHFTKPEAVGLGLSSGWRRGPFFGVDDDKSLATMITGG